MDKIKKNFLTHKINQITNTIDDYTSLVTQKTFNPAFDEFNLPRKSINTPFYYTDIIDNNPSKKQRDSLDWELKSIEYPTTSKRAPKNFKTKNLNFKPILEVKNSTIV